MATRLTAFRGALARVSLAAHSRLASALWRARARSVGMAGLLSVLLVHLGRVSLAARRGLASAGSRAHESSSGLAERLRASSVELGRTSMAAGAGLATLGWRARQRYATAAEEVRVWRAEHRRGSTAVMIGLLLALAVAGTGAAILSTRAGADVVGVNYTSRYVTVTGPGRTETYEITRKSEVTVTRKGKPRKQTVIRTRTRVVRGPGGLTTLREAVAVPGPVQHLPGDVTTVRGPTKTVTVKGPTQTVTQVVTEVVTEVVTVTNEVTVTTDGG